MTGMSRGRPIGSNWTVRAGPRGARGSPANRCAEHLLLRQQAPAQEVQETRVGSIKLQPKSAGDEGMETMSVAVEGPSERELQDRIVLAVEILQSVCIEADDRYEPHDALDMVLILLGSVLDRMNALKGLPIASTSPPADH